MIFDHNISAYEVARALNKLERRVEELEKKASLASQSAPTQDFVETPLDGTPNKRCGEISEQGHPIKMIYVTGPGWQHTHCTSCGYPLFADKSRECGICAKCRTPTVREPVDEVASARVEGYMRGYTAAATELLEAQNSARVAHGGETVTGASVQSPKPAERSTFNREDVGSTPTLGSNCCTWCEGTGEEYISHAGTDACDAGTINCRKCNGTGQAPVPSEYKEGLEHQNVALRQALKRLLEYPIDSVVRRVDLTRAKAAAEAWDAVKHKYASGNHEIEQCHQELNKYGLCDEKNRHGRYINLKDRIEWSLKTVLEREEDLKMKLDLKQRTIDDLSSKLESHEFIFKEVKEALEWKTKGCLKCYGRGTYRDTNCGCDQYCLCGPERYQTFTCHHCEWIHKLLKKL